MITSDKYLEGSLNWKGELPAKDSQIQQLTNYFENKLPKYYLDLLQLTNGGEGYLSSQQIFFRLWSIQEVIESDKDLQVREFLPNYMFFGNDGANELFGLKLDSDDKRIFMIPMILMSEEDAIVVSENFTDFIQQLGIKLKI